MTPDKPQIVIDQIANVDPDHTHPISATCVDYNPNNNMVYLSWHTRGTGEAGCLEIIDHKTWDAPKLVSYLQAYVKGTANDEQQKIDYNHCMLDGNKLFAVGNIYKKGGHMSYVKLNGSGEFDLSSQSNEETTLVKNGETESGTAGILYYTLLKDGKMVTDKDGDTYESKGKCDGNCIIRQGDDYLVASTAGFETFNTDLESTNFVSTAGKGKHITSDGNKILTLNYADRRAETTEDKVIAVVNAYSASDHTFSTPTAVASTDWIAPNDGKNTIKIDGNNAYVCCEKNGLFRYDINGGGQNGRFYIEPKIKKDGGELYTGYCNGVDVDDKYVYVAYGSAGIHILDKDTMNEVAKYTTAGGKSANYVKVVQRDGYRYVYVAYGESGISIFRIAK